MIVIDLTYKKPLDIVDEFLIPHRSFVKEGISQGLFITSGPKVPREGGIILSNLSIKNAMDLIKKDPFFINDIAEFKFIEFTESKDLK